MSCVIWGLCASDHHSGDHSQFHTLHAPAVLLCAAALSSWEGIFLLASSTVRLAVAEQAAFCADGSRCGTVMKDCHCALFLRILCSDTCCSLPFYAVGTSHSLRVFWKDDLMGG